MNNVGKFWETLIYPVAHGVCSILGFKKYYIDAFKYKTVLDLELLLKNPEYLFILLVMLSAKSLIEKMHKTKNYVFFIVNHDIINKHQAVTELFNFFHRNMFSDFFIYWIILLLTDRHIKGKKISLRVKCIQKECNEGSTNKSISKSSTRCMIFPSRKGQLRILLSFWPRECHRSTKKQNEMHFQGNGSQYLQRIDVKIKLDSFQKPNRTWFLFTQHYDYFSNQECSSSHKRKRGRVSFLEFSLTQRLLFFSHVSVTFIMQFLPRTPL